MRDIRDMCDRIYNKNKYKFIICTIRAIQKIYFYFLFAFFTYLYVFLFIHAIIVRRSLLYGVVSQFYVR